MMNKITFEEVTNYDSADFFTVMDIFSSTTKNIDSFPPDAIKKSLSTTPNYHLYVAKIDNVIVGLSLFYTFGQLKIGFLDFMAVSPSQQGKGIGTRIFQLTVEVISNKVVHCIGIIFLVLSEPASEPKEQAIRTSRVRFYAKLGSLKFENITFYLPPINRLEKPNRAHMLFFPIKHTDYVEKKTIKKFIDIIYGRVYLYEKSDLAARTLKNMQQKVRLVMLNV
jgi:GNAT superfamily N-acetyltransferase